MFNKYFDQKVFLSSMISLTLGTALYAAAYCLFIIPHGIFGGGFTGIGQIFQRILVENLHLTIASKIDFTGIIIWFLNIPLLIISYKELSSQFVFKTLYAVFLSSFLLSFSHYFPTIMEDRLTSCLVGGILVGFAIGTILKSGSSSGGTDILGLLVSKRIPGYSVGKLALLINLIIYTYTGFVINWETAIYSTIFSFITSIVIDKVHYQNIQSAVIIISKNTAIGDEINSVLKRGVTHWNACGEYTKEPYIVYLAVVSKYEMHRLITMVKAIDPKAFIIIDDKRDVIGNFKKRFDA